MHRRWHPIVILAAVLGVALLLGSCGVDWPRPTHREPPIPTIGPVIERGGGGGSVWIDSQASTNCAEPGEVVTFTLHLTNTATYPVTITGTPLLDIELHPAVQGHPDPISVQRWSHSAQYPENIDPLLAPGEIRHYEWHWVAEQRYVPTGQWDRGGITAYARWGALYDPKGQLSQPGGAQLYVGVGGRERPQPGSGTFNCREMPRPIRTP